jgi:hypothetical protein
MVVRQGCGPRQGGKPAGEQAAFPLCFPVFIIPEKAAALYLGWDERGSILLGRAAESV